MALWWTTQWEMVAIFPQACVSGSESTAGCKGIWHGGPGDCQVGSANMGIPNKQWSSYGLLWRLIGRSTGITRGSSNKHNQWITLYNNYVAWIIDYYQLLNYCILAYFLIHIVCFVSLLSATKDKATDRPINSRYTETISLLSNQLSSIEHCVNAIHSVFHHIRGSQIKNTKLTKCIMKLLRGCFHLSNYTSFCI